MLSGEAGIEPPTFQLTDDLLYLSRLPAYLGLFLFLEGFEGISSVSSAPRWCAVPRT